MSMQSLIWQNNRLILLDQTKLPDEISYVEYTDYRNVAEAIQKLIVRGAPAIGVTAAYAMVLAASEFIRDNVSDELFKKHFIEAASFMKAARPTAVNLSWAIDEMIKVFDASAKEELLHRLLEKAMQIEKSDRDICNHISCCGADIFKGKSKLKLLTHCNTGALATAGSGTALGVIKELHKRGQIEVVYADETRPLLQGSRLTAVELMKSDVPCRLIVDNMAASVMKNIGIDAVVVGADRIAGNGDAANKIGTYGLAVLCTYHHIPFYIAAPSSTFDFSIDSGAEIKIEERNPDELRAYKGVHTAPKDVPVYNPAFDVTPHELISGIITEKGVLTKPYHISIKQFERSLK